MSYYQRVQYCLKSMQMMKTNKLFLSCFQEELLTGEKPLLIQYCPNLELRYLYFKQRYLQEIATSRALIDEAYYQANYSLVRPLPMLEAC